MLHDQTIMIGEEEGQPAGKEEESRLLEDETQLLGQT